MSRPIIGRSLTTRAIISRAILSRDIGTPDNNRYDGEVALASGIWTGANQPLAFSAAGVFERVNILSVEQGGVTDVDHNNDCSFTNNSGADISLYGTIEVFMNLQVFNSQYRIRAEAGTDISIPIDPVLANTGNVFNFRSYAASIAGTLCYTCHYQVLLPNGKSVFPIVRNLDNAAPINISSVKHKILYRGPVL